MSQLLVILTTAIGLGAFIVGTSSLLLPDIAPQVYGVSSKQTKSEKSSSEEVILSSVELNALLHSLSVRNLVTGLSVLALTAFWQRVQHQAPEQADSIRSCLGIVITIGGIVPAVDAYGAWLAGRRQSARGLERLAATIHALRLVAWFVGGIWCLNG